MEGTCIAFIDLFHIRSGTADIYHLVEPPDSPVALTRFNGNRIECARRNGTGAVPTSNHDQSLSLAKIMRSRE